MPGTCQEQTTEMNRTPLKLNASALLVDSVQLVDYDREMYFSTVIEAKGVRYV